MGIIAVESVNQRQFWVCVFTSSLGIRMHKSEMTEVGNFTSAATDRDMFVSLSGIVNIEVTDIVINKRTAMEHR